MNKDLQQQNSNTQMEVKNTAGDTQAAPSSNDLSYVRTILSQESNMMGWVRTAINVLALSLTNAAAWQGRNVSTGFYSI